MSEPSATDEFPRRRSFWIGVGVATGTGLVLRVVYVLASSHTLPFHDGLFYHLQANYLAEGLGFVNPFSRAFQGIDTPTAQHPPLFPLLLAGVSWLGGRSVLTHQLVCAILGAAGVLAIGVLGRRVAGWRVGVVAASLAALYPGFWGSDFQVMSETLYVVTIALVLLASYRFWDEPSLGRAAALGLAVGVASLTRTEAVLLMLLVAAPLALRLPRVDVRRRLTALVVVGATAGLVMLPWVVRNSVVFERPMPLGMNSQSILGTSNCDQTHYGTNIGSWGCPTPGLPDEESEQGAELARRGVRYIRAHAPWFPVVSAARLGRTWEVFRPLQNPELDGRTSWVRASAMLSFFAVQVVAIVGLVQLVRQRRLVEPLLAQAVLVVIATVISYGFVRIRIPWDVACIVLAAVAIERFAARRLTAPATEHAVGAVGS